MNLNEAKKMREEAELMGMTSEFLGEKDIRVELWKGRTFIATFGDYDFWKSECLNLSINNTIALAKKRLQNIKLENSPYGS